MNKNMKKGLSLGVLGMFMVMFAMSFVAAVETDAIEEGTNTALKGISSVVNPIFRWLLGPSSDTGELIIKVLAFLMVAIVIFGIMDQVGIVKNKWLNVALGVIVSTIGIRFMPSNLLVALTAPSSAFVLIIFMGIPFLAFYFIVNKMESGFARRLAWIMYAVLIGIIVGYNLLWESAPGHDAFYSFWWIYVIFAGVAAILAIWDGTFRRFRRKMRSERATGQYVEDEENLLIAKIKKISEAITASTHDDERAALQKQYDRYKKNLDALQSKHA